MKRRVSALLKYTWILIEKNPEGTRSQYRYLNLYNPITYLFVLIFSLATACVTFFSVLAEEISKSYNEKKDYLSNIK